MMPESILREILLPVRLTVELVKPIFSWEMRLEP
jgi:hypothetical protein